MTPDTPRKPPVFILSAGTVGDIYPLLRIGRALQTRGHAVSFIGPEIHARHVARAGLSFHSIFSADEHLEIMRNPDVWHPRKGLGVILGGLREGAGRMVQMMELLPEGEDCIMLAHPLAVPAAAIARAQKPRLRVVTFYLAPSNLRSVHDPLTMGALNIPSWLPHAVRRGLWRLADRFMIDPAALPGVNGLRRDYGLPPVAHFLDHIYSTADLSLTLFPAWFGPTPPDWPQPLHEGYFQLYDPLQGQPLPDRLQHFLDQGEAPLVFTPGSGNLHAHAYFEAARQAVLRLDRRAIFLTPYREQIPSSLPDSVFWQDYVPLSSLLPHCALLAHHGGIGTTAEALRAGVPQLVAPLAYDQFDNAARVDRLGVGSGLSQAALRRGAFGKALSELLASAEVRQHCCEIAGRFREPDNEDALCAAIVQAQIR
ncbi:MAG TPA: nucleotide disphospho-sugar-binding domain-containing protein [Burkholderiaceae bacterium]